ncbi:MAG: holo-ACP synthase [Acidobacteriota bacterium]
MDLMVGTDLVDIRRMKLALQRTPRFRERVFTAGEIAYCEKKGDPYSSYAARWAAKEAFRKLHPAFVRGLKFTDVEISQEPSGRPFVVASGLAASRIKELRIKKIDVSMSHSGNYAQAVMVAVASDKGEGSK